MRDFFASALSPKVQGRMLIPTTVLLKRLKTRGTTSTAETHKAALGAYDGSFVRVSPG